MRSNDTTIMDDPVVENVAENLKVFQLKAKERDTTRNISSYCKSPKLSHSNSGIDIKITITEKEHTRQGMSRGSSINNPRSSSKML